MWCFSDDRIVSEGRRATVDAEGTGEPHRHPHEMMGGGGAHQWPQKPLELARGGLCNGWIHPAAPGPANQSSHHRGETTDTVCVPPDVKREGHTLPSVLAKRITSDSCRASRSKCLLARNTGKGTEARPATGARLPKPECKTPTGQQAQRRKRGRDPRHFRRPETLDVRDPRVLVWGLIGTTQL